MPLRTTLAGLLLALAVGQAAAADLPWSLPADASTAQVDAALLAMGQTAEARQSIQQVRASLENNGDTAAMQRWVPMLLLAAAGQAADRAL